MANKNVAYFDYAATTPIDTEVLSFYMQCLKSLNGNASSHYRMGKEAQSSFHDAREIFAEKLFADSREIVFTSGATEANNMALRGLADYIGVKNTRIISFQTEHKAVLDPLAYLAKNGADVAILPVEMNGLIDFDLLRSKLKEKKTNLVSVMAVNNETGVIQPIQKIAEIVHEYGAKLHVDAAQALGKTKVNLKEWDADVVSFSGHKIYAPKGIGALYIRRLPKMRLTPLLYGGGQQFGKRSGTIPVPLIMAFVKACSLVAEAFDDRFLKVTQLKKKLIEHLPKVMLNNIENSEVVPHILSINVNRDAQELIALADSEEIALAAGSACQSESNEGSHVLKAMGLDRQAKTSIRVSLSHLTTEEEMARLINFLRGIK